MPFNPFSALKEKIKEEKVKIKDKIEKHSEKKDEEIKHDPTKPKKKKQNASDFFQNLRKEITWDDVEFNGTLIVNVLGAVGLFRETRLGFVDSDPYVVIFVDNVQVGQTSIKKGLDVVFKEVFEIPLTGKHKELTLRVLDSDAFKEDDIRGDVRVSFKDLWQKRELRGPSPLVQARIGGLSGFHAKAGTGEGLSIAGPSSSAPVVPGKEVKGDLDYIINFRPATIDGKLKLQIERAEGIEGEGPFHLKKADVYAIFLLDTTVLGRTSVKEAQKGSSVWNENFEYDIAGEYSNLYISLWDQDSLSDDDYIGHVTIRTKDLITKKSIAGKVPFFEQKKFDAAPKPAGYLTFSTTWSPPVLDGSVKIVIEKANELLQTPGWGLPLVSSSINPFVEILLDGVSKGKTKAVKSRDPAYNETFQFSTDGPHQVLELVVWDSAGWVYAGDSLGSLRISSEQLLVQKTIKGEFYLIPYKTSNASGTLSINISYLPK